MTSVWAPDPRFWPWALPCLLSGELFPKCVEINPFFWQVSFGQCFFFFFRATGTRLGQKYSLCDVGFMLFIWPGKGKHWNLRVVFAQFLFINCGVAIFLPAVHLKNIKIWVTRQGGETVRGGKQMKRNHNSACVRLPWWNPLLCLQT